MATISDVLQKTYNHDWNVDTLSWDPKEVGAASTVASLVAVDNWPATQPVSGTFWPTTQPVSATSLPLPTGASTSARQDTGNTSLASIDAKLTSVAIGSLPNEGQLPMTSSISVAIASDQPFVQLDGGAVPVGGVVVMAGGRAVDGLFALPLTGAGAALAIADQSGLLATKAKQDSLLAELQLKADLTETQPVSGTFWQGTQPVSIATMPSTPVTGTFWQTTQPVSLASAITANPATAFGKTLTYVAVNQSGAGTTVLAAAQGSNKHKVLGAMLTMSLSGTLKFTDGVADIVGPTDLPATGGFVMPPSPIPWFETGAINRALNLITTLGAARGVVILLSEP